MKLTAILAGAALALTSVPATATDFSFTGNFTRDDNVQLFNFTVGAASTVTLKTLSYAGGVNAAGATIARGGFDPILALFDSTGTRIGQNDDGALGQVPTDISGVHYDTFLQLLLQPGNYTVSVMEYDNFAGTTLASPFSRQGQGNFTAGFSCASNQTQFRDVSGSAFCGRDSHWAFDVLNVAAATQVGGGGVPEPSTWAMMLLGFGAIGLAVRRRTRRNLAIA